jgi:hypothetical protein
VCSVSKEPFSIAHTQYAIECVGLYRFALCVGLYRSISVYIGLNRYVECVGLCILFFFKPRDMPAIAKIDKLTIIVMIRICTGLKMYWSIEH